MLRGMFLFVSLVAAAGCQSEPPLAPFAIPQKSTASVATSLPAARADTTKANPVEKLASRHLPNPVRVHPQVISGGLPEGDAAFSELRDLGIRTVISVDGAKPDVKTAEKYGLRYVHLPHGYSGIPEELSPLLAKAVRDLPGPVYVHCHHGKHRSPAAAAVACVGAGLIDSDTARRVLTVAGTGENYKGLFQSVEAAERVDDAELDALVAEFPATARLPAMAEAMVQIEHLLDHLKSIEKANWKTPADQPGLTGAHESLLLREQFTELLRTDDLKGRPDGFQKLTREAERLARHLETVLGEPTVDPAAAQDALTAVQLNCKGCHQQFRDQPLSRTSLRSRRAPAAIPEQIKPSRAVVLTGR